MHLSNSILHAIEENNFDEITAPIFVKGYLRAYARIVSLNEDDMIQQYLEIYSNEDPPITSTSNMVPELSVSDTSMKWTTYLVIIIIGALLAAWWWNQELVQREPISLDTQNSTQQSSSNTEALIPAQIEAESDNTIAPLEAVAAADTDAAAVPLEPENSAISSSVVTTTVEAEKTVAKPVEPARQIETIILPSGIITRVAPGGSDQLQIIVNADTWADIEDSSGYRLAYDLLRADQTILLTGDAPFIVFFGNGHGVELLLNDKAFNVAPYIRDDNTARLKIGS